jgi:Lar family restriction alleviation protein
MSAPELLPCPFCGGEAHEFSSEIDGDGHFIVQCKSCGAEMSRWVQASMSDDYRAASQLDAVTSWNTRADLAAAQIEAARRDAWAEAMKAAAARYAENYRGANGTTGAIAWDWFSDAEAAILAIPYPGEAND